MATEIKENPTDRVAANRPAQSLRSANEQAGVPTSILNKLARLRGQLTRWILIRGLGQVLVVVLLVLLADMLIDRFFRMDFSQRLIMLLVMVGVSAYAIYVKIIRPISKRPTLDALVYEVENKNLNLKENLLSAVQLSREQDLESLGFSPSLASATIQQGVQASEQIEFGSSLNQKRAGWNWLLLLGGLLASGGLAYGVSASTFLHTWFNRNLLLGNLQWPQDTYLVLEGVEDGKLVLPRGVDHRQLVVVTKESAVQDVEVTLEIEGQQGTTSRELKSTGKRAGREYAWVFHNVSAPFRFRATGGDATTDWIEVELVEPPALTELELIAKLPAYTGVDTERLEGNGPHSLLVGSQLLVRAQSNKKLVECIFQLGQDEFAIQSDDGLNFEGQIPGPGKQLAGGEYTVRLLDEGGLTNVRPAKIKISTREDAPPKVGAKMWGIGGMVVPRARIPLSINASDDFSVQRLAFDVNWTAGENGEEGQSGKKMIEFGPLSDNAERQQEISVDQILDLEPLRIAPGSSLRFVIAGFDNKPPSPNRGNSREFLLPVVTEETLRANLLNREIEQRRAFERTYESQLELMAELRAVAARKRRNSQTEAEFQSERERALIELTRQQKNVGTSLGRIAERFIEFLVEVKNNRLDEQENELAPDQRIEIRFDQKIIRPIEKLDKELVSIATRHVDNCRRLVRENDQLTEAVNVATTVQQEILEEMKRILDSMNESENFQEMINKLLEVSSVQKKLIEQAKQQNKADDIFDDEDIFDDK